MFINAFPTLIALALHLLVTQPLHADESSGRYETSRAKELRKKLIECKDHERYDSMDCYRALDAELEKDRQTNLEDTKRSRFGVYGESILINKANDLRAGIFPAEITGKKVREFRIHDGGKVYGFRLGAEEGCQNTTFEVLQNKPAFLSFLDSCFFTNKRGIDMSNHTYFVYDKKFKVLFSVTNMSPPFNPLPLLEWNNGVYQYHRTYMNEEKQKVREYYDFRLKNAEDAECLRMWNDDCPISPRTYQKKIMSKSDL